MSKLLKELWQGIPIFLALMLCFYIAIAVHESAHGLAMQLVGLTPRGIYIGLFSMLKFSLFNVPIQIGLIPIAGGTLSPSGFDDLNWILRFVIAFAGPLASIGIGGFFIILIRGFRILGQLVKGTGAMFKEGFLAMLPWIPLPKKKKGGGLTQELKYFLQSEGKVKGSFLFFGLISYALGILNLLPIPPLDGGRMLLAPLEALFGPGFQSVTRVLAIIGVALMLVYMARTFSPEHLFFRHSTKRHRHKSHKKAL